MLLSSGLHEVLLFAEVCTTIVCRGGLAATLQLRRLRGAHYKSGKHVALPAGRHHFIYFSMGRVQ